jgi:hypothetical protein
VLTTEWTIVAAMLLAPFAILGAAELVGFRSRRRQRARAHRSKQRL